MTQDPSKLSPGDIVYIKTSELHLASSPAIRIIEEHEVAVRSACFAVDSWIIEGSKLNVYCYFEDYPENGRFLPFPISSAHFAYLLDGQTCLISRPGAFDGVSRSNYNPRRVLPEQAVQPAPKDQGRTVDKFELVENMRKYGGNFVEKLADALIAADPKNAKRIMEAFPDIVEKYS
jgi:hypothetical protein